jgi:tripartite ATP-independent transporter DctM subunit
MSDAVIGLLGFGAALMFIALGVPVAVSLGVIGVLGFWLLNGPMGAVFILASGPFESTFSYTLSVIPLFLMMGVFATNCGLSSDLYRSANVLVGRFRGGLAIATILACAGFGAICGSSLATVATIGRVAMPEMRKAGYDDRLSAASIAAGGTLGVLIPPSILLIVYGILTEQSIGALFGAALIPGLLAVLLYVIAVLVQVRMIPELVPQRTQAVSATRQQNMRDLFAAWPAVMIFGVVIGGIQFGIFSPTEAASVGAFGTALVALGRKTLTQTALWNGTLEVVSLTGMIFFITIGAGLFNYFIETSGLPQGLVAWITNSGMTPGQVIIGIILFYLILGCFMDSMAMIFLTIPFVFPVIQAQGYDPIWFGVLVVSVAEIGLITPPIGMNLFVLQGVVKDLSARSVIVGIVPFLISDLVRIVLLVAFPALALWLPGLGR